MTDIQVLMDNVRNAFPDNDEYFRIYEYGTVNDSSHYFARWEGDEEITLDGHFSIKQLEALVEFMKATRNVPPVD